MPHRYVNTCRAEHSRSRTKTHVHNTTASWGKERGKMLNDSELYLKLEDVCHKYERLTSLISIVQMCVAEIAEVAGIPSDSLDDALYEIELGMDDNNKRLKEIIQQRGGAA